MLLRYKILAFILFLVILASSFYIYQNNSNGEIITIYPEVGEIKIKPLETGGSNNIEGESLIYEKLSTTKTILDKSKKVTLLPEPEQPLNINGKGSDELQENTIETLLSDLAEKSNKIEEVNLDDLSQESIQNKNNADIFEIEDPEKANSLKEKIEPVDNKTLQIVKVENKSNKLLPLKNVKNKRLSFYKLQLASVKSDKEGQKKWLDLKKKFPKTLGKLSMQLVKVKPANNNIYYSMQVGEYPSFNEAKAACKKLAGSGQSCIPIK